MSAILAHQFNSTMAMGPVPDSQQYVASNNSPTDSFPSLYDPLPFSTVSKEMAATEFDQFLSHSTFASSDPSYSMWGLTPPTLTSSACTSALLSGLSPSARSPPSSDFLPNQPGDYLDLSLLCETGLVSGDDASSLFSTCPPSPYSAPLSPEEQEIQDIVSSFQDLEPSYVPPLTPLAASPVGYSGNECTSTSSPTLTQFLSAPLSPPTSTQPIPPLVSSQPSSPPTLNRPVSSSTLIKEVPLKENPSKKRNSRRKLPLTKKKERKKEQNKTAALRYRQKKKEESQAIDSRQEMLEAKNKELKMQVHGLESEISYLKQLWTEICQSQQRRRL